MKSRAPILVVFLLAVLAIVALTLYGQRTGGDGQSAASPGARVKISMLYSTEKKDWVEQAAIPFR